MNKIDASEDAPAVEGDGRALLRRAAGAGPGYRGRRETASLDQQSALAKEIAQSGEHPPAYLGTHTHWIDRRAKLFESGEYPDKGVTVTRDDLNRLAQSFDLPVPILIEHAESPLEIGFLTQVETVGDELFGNLALTQEADALIRRSGAKALSLGLARDLSEIVEVSLVQSPRVQSAQLFGQAVRFWSEIDPKATEPREAGGPSTGQDWRARFQALSAKVETELAERKLEEWVKDGRLFPAQLPFARALMEVPDTIDFDGDRRPVHQLLIAMLERQPPHGLFSESAPCEPEGSEALFLPEEAAFYRRHFPDVSLDVIAARRAAR